MDTVSRSICSSPASSRWAARARAQPATENKQRARERGKEKEKRDPQRRKSASCPTDRLVTGRRVGRSGELQKWKGSFKGRVLLLLNGINRQEGERAANTNPSLYFKFQVRCHCSGSIDEVVAPNEASKDSRFHFPLHRK